MYKLLVTRDEREWYEKHASKLVGPEKGIQFPVIDVKIAAKHVKERINNEGGSRFIEIQPISENKYKNINKGMTFEKDPEFGLLYGICTGVDNVTGNPRWQKIYINDKFSLDTNRDADLQIWTVIRFFSGLAGSPFQAQLPYFKVYDPIVEAEKEAKKVEMLEQAFDRIRLVNDKPRELLNIVRWLGAGNLYEGISVTVLKSYLLKMAQLDPINFNRKWDSKDRSFAEILSAALQLNIIKQDPDRGITYNNIPLGVTEEEAIKFLRTDGNICQAVNRQVIESDHIAISLEKPKSTLGKVAAGKKPTEELPPIPEPTKEEALLADKEFGE
jgi:hypothetical protein